MFTCINVSRSTHCAIDNLTGDPSSRASPDACGPPPHAVWLSAGISHLAAVCGGPHANGDCGVPVVLALQRVPDCASVSRRAFWHPGRPRRAAFDRRADDRADALADTLPGSCTQSCAADLWLVLHPVELCDPGGDPPDQTRHRGLGGNRAPLAPRAGLGLETRQTGGE